MEKKLPKIDLKDRKILAILEKNAREPASLIAKKVGLSKPSVSARIERLVKEGAIDQFLIYVGVRALQLSNFRLYVKFQNTLPDFEKELAEYLYTQGSVRWFCFCQGEWDIVIRIIGKDIYGFRRFEQDFLAKFGKYIIVRAFGVVINDAFHNCTYVTGNQGNNSDLKKDYAEKTAVLSDVDAKIIYWLLGNSRMPLRDIAGKVGISPEAVAYHIKKLEKNGAITGYAAKVCRPKMGYSEAKVMFWFQYPSPQSTAKFRKYCESHEYVSFYGDVIGPWDMEVDFDVRNVGQLYDILREMRTKFGGLIRDFKVVNKIREVEVNFMAKEAGVEISAAAMPQYR